MINPVKLLLRRRFDGYAHALNVPRADLPVDGNGTAAVIGAGIAGISAAALLAERGFSVTLFERNTCIGGKAGSWVEKLDGDFPARVDHGFHGFFRQYYNLRRLMQRFGADSRLVPIDDYRIMTRDGGGFSFRGVETTPVLNMLSLRRTGVYRLGELMKHRESGHLVELLRYDGEETFRRYDGVSFRDFADAARLPASMRLMFTTFSRSFFADPELMSMAELMRSFHFYFLSNDLGLLYDYLGGDFETTFTGPARRWLESRRVRVVTSCAVEGIGRHGGRFSVAGEEFDAVILAADVRGARAIAGASPFLAQEDPELHRGLTGLRESQGYAVIKAWTDRAVRGGLPPFLAVERREALDSITLNHQVDPGAARWADAEGGSVIELHSYALPRGLAEPDRVRALLLQEAGLFLHELSGAKVRHVSVQVRNDFTAFHTGMHALRPGTGGMVPGFALAGDWVDTGAPAMLMEAACTSGFMAANRILSEAGLREEPLFSVPLRGILAPRR